MHRRHLLAGLVSATAALAVTRTAVAQPVAAGAMPTPAYLAMATKGGLFLENSARDAYAKTGNPRVKRFARAEVTEQVNLANKIDAVTGGTVAVPVDGGRPGGGLAGPDGLVAAWWRRPSRWRAAWPGRPPAPSAEFWAFRVPAAGHPAE